MPEIGSYVLLPAIRRYGRVQRRIHGRDYGVANKPGVVVWVFGMGDVPAYLSEVEPVTMTAPPMRSAA